MSGKSNKKNRKNKTIDMRKVYIDWQRDAVANASKAVNMVDYGKMTDEESRDYLDTMQFTLIFGWELCPDI
jgi:hypothetical protein